MPNEQDDLPEDWDQFTDEERRRFRLYRDEEHFQEYLSECSPEQRARAMWEQS